MVWWSLAYALAAPVPVEVVQSGDGWSMLRGGEPFVLNGAGGRHALGDLAAAGGTSIRTWGVGPETAELLDEAQAHGLTVSLGLWLGHERHGFDYSDPAQVAKQLAESREAVLAYKDHPALLMWGVGNEMEGFEGGDDPEIWSAVCGVAQMVQELDPHHPVISTTADIGGGRIAGVHDCPHIDIHGVNSYGGGPSVVERYRAAGGSKPIVLTEYGPPGVWEIPATEFGAFPELTSTAKAGIYGRMARHITEEPQILGGYAFLWGWKTEATATWFGLYLPDGTRMGGVDALAEVWGGTVEPAPKVSALVVDGGDVVEPGATVRVHWEVEGEVETEWTLRPEILEQATGGDAQALPPSLDGVVSKDANHVVLTMPRAHGVYRLYAVARNGRGAGAAASVPLLVGRPRSPGEPLPMPWWVYQDEGVGGPWVPSGWMGATEGITVDLGWTLDCRSPPSCVQATAPAGTWSGVAWQTPANNWGDVDAGVDLSEAKFLRLWARADDDQVRANFGVGLLEEDRTHPDSLRVDKSVRLGTTWKEVRVRLRGDASSLITGFWWGVSTGGHPVRIYLDDIRFE